MLIPTISKDIDEQLQIDHSIIDVEEQLKSEICVALLRYNVHKPEKSYCQVRLFAKEKEFEGTVLVIYELEELIYLLDKMNFVYDEFLTNKPI